MHIRFLNRINGELCFDRGLDPIYLTSEHHRQIESLYSQLSGRPVTIDEYRFRRFLDEGNGNRTALFAFEGETIVGMACLNLVRTLRYDEAVIEDLVVDETHRRQGIARALTEDLLKLAKGEGVGMTEHTCRPGREAANRFYRSMGFEQIETNVYRYMLGSSSFPDENDERFSTSKHTLPDIPSLKTPPPEDR